MPVTQAEHDRRLKVPAVCELLPLRDLPLGDNIMVRTNGAFVAGYELQRHPRVLRDGRRPQSEQVDAGGALSQRSRRQHARSVPLRDFRAPRRSFGQLHSRTAHRAVGGDGARFPSAPDVAPEGEQRLLLREPASCVLDLGPAHSREALPLRSTEPQPWWIHSKPEEGHPACAEGARDLSGRVRIHPPGHRGVDGGGQPRAPETLDTGTLRGVEARAAPDPARSAAVCAPERR